VAFRVNCGETKRLARFDQSLIATTSFDSANKKSWHCWLLAASRCVSGSRRRHISHGAGCSVSIWALSIPCARPLPPFTTYHAASALLATASEGIGDATRLVP
jgi:hypothetical protein